ncbi:MAG: SH3 domain-containing protein [Planctomycetota bacterium]
MSRALLASAFAFVLIGSPLAAADDTLAPVTATLEKNTNIRYGPTTSAKLVVTLKSGSQVEVFGPSKSSPDWYVIRFPKEGTVWIDRRSLTPIDNEARFKVSKDKTRARSDSTLSGDIVAELSLGEIVESKGLTTGDWRAVYIPDAVAYVAKSLVTMPKDVEKRMQENADKAAAAAQAWQNALAIYTTYAEQVRANPKAAVGLDWAGLALQLDTVIVGHASASVRLTAQRVRDSLAALVPSAQEVAKAANITPPASLPAVPEVKKPEPVVATPDKPTTSTDPKPLSPEEVAKIQATLPKPSIWQAEGLLVADDQFLAKVGTRDVLVDGDGNVKAFIKSKDGVDLKLSELRDRYIGAKGELLTVPPEQSGLAKPTKLIIASEVAPVRQ